MAPSSSAIIGGHATARCRGEGGTSSLVCLDEVWEALCFLRHFCDELNVIIFATLILCTRGLFFFLVFWALAGACQRNGVSGFTV